jgi:membrane protease YdiL (CAAX protease family)
MNKQPQISYPQQFAILLALIGGFMLIGAIVILMLAGHKVMLSLDRPEEVNLARWLNTVAAFLMFFMPAVVFARIVNRKPLDYLGFNRRINRKQIGIVIVLTLAAMITSGALGELNQHIPLPTTWMIKAKAMEDAYKNSMLSMIMMKNVKEYLLVLLVIATAPAIFEEVLFRGAFQPIFIGWTKRAWIGIVITSIIFSAIHISYFGFLPRFALGMVLGYIFYYGKNIWLNILLHFLNNALVVTNIYKDIKHGQPIEKAMDESMPMWWIGLFGMVGLLLLFRLFKKETRKVLATQPVITMDENPITQ